MKIIGLMITRNEIHFIKYSLPNLLEVCDQVVVLDDSNDGTFEYLNQFDNVVVKRECKIPNKLSYRDRRQYVLEIGRKLGGTHFVVIDADEIMSKELIDRLSGGFTGALYCRWLHMRDMWYALNDYKIEIQGIAYEDIGIDYYGRDLVHEDRIPIGRDGIYSVLKEPLLHFHFSHGNERYNDVKDSYYKCLEILEGYDVDEINMKYINEQKFGINLSGQFMYPDYVDERILLFYKGIDEMLEKIVGLVQMNPELFYNLDIWRIPRLTELCMKYVPGFDDNKILYKNETPNFIVKSLIRYRRGIELIKRGEFMSIIAFLYWRLTGRCFYAGSCGL